MDLQGGAQAPHQSMERYQLEPFAGMAALQARLRQGPTSLAVRGMMDARLASDEIVRKLLFGPADRPSNLGLLAARVSAEEAKLSPVEPEMVYSLGEELGYRVEAFWQPENPTAFDALFVKSLAAPHLPLAMATYKAAKAVPTPSSSPNFWELFTNKGGNYSPTHREDALSVPDVGSIRNLMRKTLPEYMIPSVFVSLPSLPRTENGKVDRKQLPEPSPSDLEASGQRDTPFEAPSGEMQEFLAEAWRDMLMASEVSANDCFFALGGHSLLAMQLVHRIKQKTGLQLKLADVVQSSVLSELAK